MDGGPTEKISKESIIPEPLKPNQFKILKFNRRLSAIFSIIARTALLILAVLVMIFIGRELTITRYAITQVAVPPVLVESGFSEAVMANRIRNKLNEIIKKYRLADVAGEYRSLNSSIDLNLEMEGIDVPVKAMIEFLGEILRIEHQKDITCDIVVNGNILIAEVNIDSQVERHEIPLNDNLDSAVNILSMRSSESILKYTNPYVLARHYLFEDSEGCFNLGRYILRNFEGQEDIEPVGFFAVAGGYMTNGDFARAELEIRRGLQKYGNDLNLHAALETQLRFQGKIDEALKEARYSLSMLNDDTPLNRRARTYLNLGHNMQELNMLDSAIYYYEQTLMVDRNFDEVYVALAELYLDKNDTLKSIAYLQEGIDIGLSEEYVNRRYPGLLNRLRKGKLLSVEFN